MTNKEKFLMCLQAAVIVQDIRTGRSIGSATLSHAMSIKDKIFDVLASKDPEWWLDSVDEYVRYQYQTSPLEPRIPKPSWLITAAKEGEK